MRLGREHEARLHRLAVEQHRARAADALLATDVGAVQLRARGAGSRRAAGGSRRIARRRRPLTSQRHRHSRAHRRAALDRSSARSTRIGTRWRRYSAEARTSEAGSASSRQRAAAAVDVGRLQPRAGEPLGGAARVARPVGDGAEPDADPAPAPVGCRAGRWRPRSPRRSRRDAARARRRRPRCRRRRGTRSSSSISFGSSAVVYGPSKNASASSSRRPAWPTMRRRAPSVTAQSGHLTGRIGVAQRAAERAAVADLAVADEGDGSREQRDALADHGDASSAE